MYNSVCFKHTEPSLSRVRGSSLSAPSPSKLVDFSSASLPMCRLLSVIVPALYLSTQLPHFPLLLLLLVFPTHLDDNGALTGVQVALRLCEALS